MWIYGCGMPHSLNISKQITDEIEAKKWEGWGTSLKPAHEPIVMARKPLEGTIVENISQFHTGAINIDDCRVEYEESDSVITEGRWPSNVMHDGSDEVLTEFAKYGDHPGGSSNGNADVGKSGINTPLKRGTLIPRNDSGSAARFFYSSKASKEDRAGSNHPTVKPKKLMEFLVKLVTPERGLVMDIFAGSGSTGEAALQNGFDIILIEREEEYIKDITRRLDLFTLFDF